MKNAPPDLAADILSRQQKEQKNNTNESMSKKNIVSQTQEDLTEDRVESQLDLCQLYTDLIYNRVRDCYYHHLTFCHLLPRSKVHSHQILVIPCMTARVTVNLHHTSHL